MYSPVQRIFLAILSGILLIISWNNIFPGLIFIALVPLLVLESDLSNRLTSKSGNLFWLSWLSFAVWNGTAAWWVGYASFGGAIALLSFNSFWQAVVFWLFHISKRKLKIKIGWLILVAYWLAYEYIYLRTEISWPWFNLGNIFGNMVELVQWYEYTGTLGGTLWVLLINIGIAGIIQGYNQNQTLKSVRFRIVALTALLLLPSFLSTLMYNHYREIDNPARIAIIQPNIDPYKEKFGKLTPMDQLNIMLDEAEKANRQDIDYFIAPETAIIGVNNEGKIHESKGVVRIKKFLERNPGAKFVIGAETQKEFLPGEALSPTARKNDSTNVWEDRFNSAMQIDSTGYIPIYHKSKLVVGVEKMPFSKYLKFLEKFPVKLGGTYGSLGDQDFRGTFAGGNSTSVAPIICFESIYGQYVTDYVKGGATILFVITNDGWWKNSLGTWQHLNLSRLRAIETRRSVARSANTGISAFINQKGDIIHSLEIGKRGSIIESLNNNKQLTFYVKYGDYTGIIALLMSLICLGSILFLRIRKRTPKRS